MSDEDCAGAQPQHGLGIAGKVVLAAVSQVAPASSDQHCHMVRPYTGRITVITRLPMATPVAR